MREPAAGGAGSAGGAEIQDEILGDLGHAVPAWVQEPEGLVRSVGVAEAQARLPVVDSPRYQARGSDRGHAPRDLPVVQPAGVALQRPPGGEQEQAQRGGGSMAQKQERDGRAEGQPMATSGDHEEAQEHRELAEDVCRDALFEHEEAFGHADRQERGGAGGTSTETKSDAEREDEEWGRSLDDHHCDPNQSDIPLVLTAPEREYGGIERRRVG